MVERRSDTITERVLTPWGETEVAVAYVDKWVCEKCGKVLVERTEAADTGLSLFNGWGSCDHYWVLFPEAVCPKDEVIAEVSAGGETLIIIKAPA